MSFNEEAQTVRGNGSSPSPFIRGNDDLFSIMHMCKVMRVSRSGYYAWRDRPESERVIQNRELLQHIHHIHLQSRQAYGAKKTC